MSSCFSPGKNFWISFSEKLKKCYPDTIVKPSFSFDSRAAFVGHIFCLTPLSSPLPSLQIGSRCPLTLDRPKGNAASSCLPFLLAAATERTQGSHVEPNLHRDRAQRWEVASSARKWQEDSSSIFLLFPLKYTFPIAHYNWLSPWVSFWFSLWKQRGADRLKAGRKMSWFRKYEENS